VVGIYRNGQLLRSWRLVSSHTRTVDEYWIMVKLLCDSAEIRTGELQGIIISSVVPELTTSFVKMSRFYFRIEPMIVSHELNLGLRLLVREPKQVGADRICNIVAAKKKYSLPLTVVDLGTATTFDVLDSAGNYIGGSIAPGLVTGALELFRKAAQLHEIDPVYPDKIIGKTTKEHLQGGIFGGHIAMIEGMIARIKAELAVDSLHVIATGGFSEEIAEHTVSIDSVNLDLTLEGLHAIYNLNKQVLDISSG
jgi:type III pantothenate kinase